MRFERTRDVLELAQKIHHRLSQFYAELSVESEKTRMQLLLDYMSRHEKHLEEVLSDYKEEASKKVLEAWFQCTSTEKAEKHFRALLNEPHTNIDEIVEMAIALDDCLLGIYKEMALRAEKEEIRDVFNNLLSMETKEKQKLIRNALIIEDF